ncbi:MAG: hypothetical protein GC136_10430 [Alphaproteobacteria bacterium]|nr:hypothetical protein [Alphaproteobacteria bacterium]
MSIAKTDFEDPAQAAARLAKERIKAEAKRLYGHIGDGPLKAARYLAQTLFKDVRYGNRPYFEHLEHVALEQMKGPQPYGHRVVAGYLHDLLEDIEGWTAQDLLDIGFPKYTVDIIVAVTKQEGELYFDAMQRVSLNAEAIHVKLADLGMNSNARGLPRAPTEKDLGRLQKYWMAQRYLEAVRDGEIKPGSCPVEFITKNIDAFAKDESHKQQLLAILHAETSASPVAPTPQERHAA